LPPQNIEAEMGMLGSIMLEDDNLDEVLSLVRPADLYRNNHQILYEAIIELYAEMEPIDALTVANRLIRQGKYDEVGKEEFLRSIIDGTPNAANAVYYAQIVKQKAIARHLIESCNETLREAYSGLKTADELMALSESRMLAVGDAAYSLETEPAISCVKKAMDRLDRRSGQISGISSGWGKFEC
jgi:replicative DNA helicase